MATKLLSAWVWCLHCEQVHARHKWDLTGGSCPTAGCDGFLLGDGISWGQIRHGREDRYPAVPVPGAVYPLYE